MRDDLVRLLSARRGHFRLESGHHGDLWLDLDALLHRPHLLRPFVIALAGRLSAHAVEAVCGPLVGGAFVAQAVAAELGVSCFWTERVAGPVGYRLPDGLRGRAR